MEFFESNSGEVEGKENSDGKKCAVTERRSVNEEIVGFGVVPGLSTAASLTHELEK